jgi:hypothetical protein
MLLPPTIALLARSEAFNASDLAISGVDAIITPTAKPEANRPARAMSRDFIVNILSPTGLVGSSGLVQFWSSANVSHNIC